MGRDLKNFLIELRDNNSAFDLNSYFGSADFADDYDEFEKDIKYESQLDVLAFLNDEFTHRILRKECLKLLIKQLKCLGKTQINPKGEKSILLISDKCFISINPDKKILVQCNP